MKEEINVRGKIWMCLIICLLFAGNVLALSNNSNNISGKVVARITYRSNVRSIQTLQPIVVITQPQDGAVVTDPHLVVRGYAMDEAGMNYWEWEWHWKGGSYSNSSYFQIAEYVEFRIDIYGLHSGWNLIIVRFKNIYGAIGEDSVNVTYNPPNNPPNKPSKPEGPNKGKVKETLYFNTVTTDPDGDSLEYLIDWGDGTNTGWLGPITSGTPFETFHAWDEPGTYAVRAKARDIPYLEESEWSDTLIVTIVSEGNNPPSKPDRPQGPTNGKVGVTYTYSSRSVDPDEDQIYYLFDWGDGSNSGWIGPFESGQVASASHKWSKVGFYQVKVKAKDTEGKESEWSDPLPITMPKSKNIKERYHGGQIFQLPILSRLKLFKTPTFMYFRTLFSPIIGMKNYKQKLI